MRAMANEPFRVAGSAGGSKDVRILTARGPITFASSAALVDAVHAVTEPKLVIDLTDVPSVDSMAVGALVRTYVHCQKSGRRLAFVGMSPRIKSVLKLTGIDPLFDAYASVAEAEAALA
jgi:anti-anti-sigma factor